jgi:hypothetical protein
MANEKISGMPAAAGLSGPELVPIVQGGANKSATVEQIVGFGSAELTIRNNGTAQTLTLQNTYYQWETGWGQDLTPVNATTDTAAGSVTMEATGRVTTLCMVNWSCDTATGVRFNIFKNGNPAPQHLVAKDVVTINSADSNTIVGIDDCAIGDIYDLRVECTGTTGVAVTIYNANLSIKY